MAPRKQTKQAAAESTVAAADGNVTPPKKRKTVARSTVAEASKQAKSKAAAAPRHTKQAKRLLEEELGPVFSPKKLRSRDKNVVAAAVTTKNAAPKTDTRTKSKKVFVNKQQREKADEEVVEQQVAEKKTRGKSVKKAGTKPKAKAPVARKRRGEVEENEDVENADDVVGEENPPVRRTTRRGKTVDEENVAPAATRAKRPRKRPETKVLAEADDTPEEKENDAEMIVTGKKSRERTKKTDTKIAKITVKEKSKKNSAKAELALSEETETEEQTDLNTTIEEDKLIANMKNSKKGNAKKATPKGKRNVEMAEENNDAQVEKQYLSIISEVEGNGEAEIAQIVESKQKKKNTGKVNAAMNEKTEAKKRQKKGQMVATSMNEEKETKDVAAEDETTKTTNLALESLDENNEDVSLNESNNVSEEENNEAESTTVTMKNIPAIKVESSGDELERSATFLVFK